eukprot:9374291-Pyramimonas_sp.AAC.1
MGPEGEPNTSPGREYARRENQSHHGGENMPAESESEDWFRRRRVDANGVTCSEENVPGPPTG